MTRLIAFDLSLRATGFCDPDGHAETFKPPAKLDEAARLEWWRQCFVVLREQHQPTCVAVEDSFIKFPKASKILQRQVGVFLAAFAGIPIVWVPAASLKLAFSGHGNATKSTMWIAARNRGLTVLLDDNGVDAWALWHVVTAMGEPAA